MKAVARPAELRACLRGTFRLEPADLPAFHQPPDEQPELAYCAHCSVPAEALSRCELSVVMS